MSLLTIKSRLFVGKITSIEVGDIRVPFETDREGRYKVMHADGQPTLTPLCVILISTFQQPPHHIFLAIQCFRQLKNINAKMFNVKILFFGLLWECRIFHFLF